MTRSGSSRSWRTWHGWMCSHLTYGDPRTFCTLGCSCRMSGLCDATLGSCSTALASEDAGALPSVSERARALPFLLVASSSPLRLVLSILRCMCTRSRLHVLINDVRLSLCRVDFAQYREASPFSGFERGQPLHRSADALRALLLPVCVSSRPCRLLPPPFAHLPLFWIVSWYLPTRGQMRSWSWGIALWHSPSFSYPSDWGRCVLWSTEMGETLVTSRQIFAVSVFWRHRWW